MRINIFKVLIVCLFSVFIGKPIINTVNVFLNNSEEISFLMIENESLEDENNEEEEKEVEKIIQTRISDNLTQEFSLLYSENIQFDSDFEYKLIDPPPEFIL